MSSFDDLVARMSGQPTTVAQQKQQDVNRASVLIQSRLASNPTKQDFYAAAVARQNDIGTVDQGQVFDDLRTLTPLQLQMKYGDQVGQELNAGRVAGESSFASDRLTPIDPVTGIRDGAASLGLGVFNGFGGLAALGAGIVDRDLGARTAVKVGQFNDWVRERQSPEMQGHLRANATLNDLQDKVIAAEVEAERDQMGGGEPELLTAARRIGREAVSHVKTAWSDPFVRAEGTLQGTGSMLAGGAISKSLGVAGGIATRLTGVAVPEAATGMTASIAAQEAGGAYQASAQQVMSMSHEQLLAGSPTYQRLLAEGMSQSEAQAEVANRTGLQAAAVQAPIAAATGKLVSKFEGSPFKAGSFREALANVGKEAIEEGIQSGFGQFSQNLAIKTNANQNQDLAQGVGGQIGEGALYGSLSAGMVQGPAAVLSGTVNSAKLAGRVTKQAVTGAADWIMARGDKVIDEINAKSSVAPETVNQATEAAAQAAPEAMAQMEQAILDNDPASYDEQTNRYIQQVLDASSLSPVEVPTHSEALSGALDGSTNVFEAIQRASKIITDDGFDDQDRIAAGLFILKATTDRAELLTEQLPQALESLPAEHPALAQFKQFSDVLSTVVTNPLVRKAVAAANRIQNTTTVEQLSPETQGAATRIDNVVTAAQYAPETVRPELVERVLEMRSSGELERNGIILTEAQVASLEAASTLKQLAEKQAERQIALSLANTTQDAVSRQIRSDLSNHDFTYKSATQHTVGVLLAMGQGKIDVARERMKAFIDFAQSMANKVGAINESFNSGVASEKNTTPFMAVDPNTGEWFESKIWTNGKNFGSVRLAQQAALDADTVIQMANTLARKYPQLGAQWVMPVAMTTGLNRPVAEVARAAKTAGRAAPVRENSTPAKQETTPTATEREPRTARQVITDVASNPQGPVSELSDRPVNNPTAGPVETSSVEDNSPRPKTEQDTVPVESKTEAKSEPEAKPQVQDESERSETVAEQTIQNISEVVPGLVGDADNAFYKSFKVPAEQRSRLVSQASPGRLMQKVFASAANFKAFSKSDKPLTAENVEGYGKLLKLARPVYTLAVDRLEAALTDRRKSQLENDAATALRFNELKALNITNQDGKYNDNLIQSAVLAGLNWAMNAGSTTRNYDEEDVARFLNKDAMLVEDDELDFFNEGMPVADAKAALAQAIVKFWGVIPDKNVGIGLTQGIPEAVAAEIIYGLQNAGLLEVQTANITTGDGSLKTFNRLVFSSDKSIQGIKDQIRSFPDAIAQAVELNPTPINYIGAAPTEQARTQLRNPMVPNTRQQMTVLKKAQNQAYYWNQSVADFYEAIGDDGLIEMFGGGSLNDNQNKKHQATLEGKNRTLLGAMDQLRSLRAQTETQGELTEVPVYYDYAFTRVNRLQMLGKYNPQSSKLMREAVLPTWNILNLNDQDQNDLFLLGVAQAWGVKVHKQPRAKSLSDVKALAEGKFKPALDLIGQWLESGFELDANDVAVLKDSFGGDLSPMAIHAGIEFARSLSVSHNEKGAFKTAVYVEADGVTDGPINAMVNLAPGAFTTEWVDTVAKGGLFLTSESKSMNDHFVVDPSDLYESTKNHLVTLIGEQQAKSLDPKVKGQFQSLLRVMDVLLGKDFNLTDQETVDEKSISRNIIKNPLTVTIYGSGADGIAGKILQAMTDAFYKQQTAVLSSSDPIENVIFGNRPDAAEKLQQFYADITNLTEKVVENRRGQLSLNDVSKTTNTKMGEGADYAFTTSFDKNAGQTTSQMKNFQQNILNLFVAQMRGAINQSIGETAPVTTVIQKAIDTQSIFNKFTYEKLINEALERKAKADPSFRKSDFLSQTELDEIQRKQKLFSPYVQTGTQNIFVGGSERFEINQETSRSLGGDLSSGAQIAGPKQAGVGGIPFTVISTGDGQMIQNFIANTDTDGYLAIFDGVNFKLSSLESDSQAMNQAVYDGWQANPVEAVRDAYGSFLEDAKLTDLSDEHRMALMTSLFGKSQAGKMSQEQDVESQLDSITQALMGLKNDLDRYTNEIAARKRVMTQVGISVDHMASAEAPYHNGGKISLDGMTADEQVAVLNGLLDKELAKNQNKKTPELPKQFEGLGVVDGSVRVISSEEFNSVARSIEVPQEHRAILLGSLKALRNSGWRIVLGDANAVREFQTKHGLNLLQGAQGSNETVYGYTVVGDRTIYIHDVTPEVLTHELIHAATVGRVADVYFGEASQTDIDAVARIEGLMAQWKSMQGDFSTANHEIQRAYNNSLDAIERWEANINVEEAVRKTMALNEFMAWSLANQRLIKVQSKTKANPIVRIAGEILQALKELIWGKGKAPKLDDSFASNLRFNTLILMESQKPVPTQMADTVAYMSVNYGQSQRLADLDATFLQKVASLVNSQPNVLAKAAMADKSKEATAKAVSVTQTFASAFPMTMQEKTTFHSIVAAFMAAVEMDGNVLNSISDLHAHVVKNLEVEDFMVDREGDNEADRYQAAQKYDALVGKKGTARDAEGRTSLMPAFLALAQTNDEFRSILNKMELPKKSTFKKGTLDENLDSLGSMAMDRLGEILGGEQRNAPNVQIQLDALTQVLADVADDRSAFRTNLDAVQKVGAKAAEVVDTANDWIVDRLMQPSINATIDKLQAVEEKVDNKYGKYAVAATKLLVSALSKDRNDGVSETVLATTNKLRVWKPVAELMSELVGRTEANGSIYDLIKQARSMIQQTRQRYREEVPKIIASKFTRELSKDEWSHLFHGLAKTDVAALRNGFSVQEIVSFLRDPSLMAGHIARLEARLAANDPARSGKMIQRSKELALFMNEGKVSGNLLRNAEAIARLLGEPEMLQEADVQVQRDIDQLVSLYALSGLSEARVQAITELATNEEAGLGFVVNYLEGQRKGEIDKIQTDKARMNHYKGYVPTQGSGASLIIANKAESLELLKRGYTEVGTYEGSLAEHGSSPKAYYFAPVSGRAGFSQGIMQNVHTTASGIDPVTGHTYGALTAGKIVDQITVARIFKLRSRNEKATEPLMPIYDGNGKVVAYERSVLAGQMMKQDPNTQLHEVLGQWRGRQIEEGLAGALNEQLINKLYDMWKAERSDRADEYVDLFDRDELKKDSVLADAVSLFTPAALEKIQNTFGKTFMVRRDLLNDVVGYRSASIGDAWTGITRFDEKTNENIQRAVMGIFGAKAYQMAVKAERITQQVMADARTLIVVKSVIVPVSNIISNIYQLAARGVPMVNILTQLPKKASEIDKYMQNRLREIQIEAELRASEKDPVVQRKLKVELRTIQDMNERMSIWPLIEAGEFSSVSDGQLIQDDLALSQGRLLDYVEGLVAKVPKELQTAAKYAWISKDTALFRGMTKMMQYGDFLAKSIQYDDLVKRKKNEKEKALQVISDEFVNYDRLPGRSRSYLESLGMLWFWNYKLRITKVALSTIRENPLHALIRMMAPTPEIFGSVGDPITDNIFSVLEDGRLGYSIGPAQAFHSLNLNPWLNIVR